ncbi:transposase [Cupriavidus sp. L7L]|uniref:transposase n=1 Tax=Cupriavidus sp. L7L TaxID=2546443 RepID=UPI001054E990|nr:transposase [Cupriavidus sp. L7L]TDF53378.1 transposase [Cupriavidus sp. L7L]
MTMQDFRRIAGAMDQRVRQLSAEGVTGRELIHRMAGHMPDLQRVWVGASDQQLAELCQDYPGFYHYASLMEEAAEAERANPSKKYLEMPELNAPLKSLLAALLTDAATLERGYQALIDAASREGMVGKLDELNQRHRIWLDERERFVGALKETRAPTIVLEVVVPAIGQMADRIAQLEKRAVAE